MAATLTEKQAAVKDVGSEKKRRRYGAEGI